VDRRSRLLHDYHCGQLQTRLGILAGLVQREILAMKTVSLPPRALILSLGLLLFLSPAVSAAEPAPAKAAPAESDAKRITRLVIIVHPCPYEIYHRPAPGTPLYPFREMEKTVFEGWLKSVEALPASAFVVQIDMPNTAPGPDQLHAACVARLGAERVCRVAGENQYPEKPVPLLDYYERIEKKIHEQFRSGGLAFDPAHCETELWGQSFEGCAPGYGTAVCRRLGLEKPFRFDYSKSVPDARFLLKLRRWELAPLADSDVVAYVFDLEDGTSAALFQARKQDQWLDHRAIELQLDPKKFWVSDKQGKLVWPKEGESAGPEAVRMMCSEEHFLRARGGDSQDLKLVIEKARVQKPPKKTG